MEWHERGMDTIHDKNNIKGFFGEYRWLSNFHLCPIEYDGLKYGSSEAAYQASKTEDDDVREQFTGMTPKEAMKVGRNGIELRKDWPKMKIWYMKDVLLSKFTQNEDLKRKLLDTGDKYLEETNWWGDTFWGVCKGIGENHLGTVLMMIRDDIRTQENDKNE